MLYDFMKRFSNGLSATKKGQQWGNVNTDGTLKIPLIYDDAWNFINGIAQVRLGFEFFSIDSEGAAYLLLR